MPTPTQNSPTEEIQSQIEITNISPTPLFGPGGQIERMMNIEFKVAGYGPFSQQVPFEDFDVDVLMAMVLDFATKVVKLKALQV